MCTFLRTFGVVSDYAIYTFSIVFFNFSILKTISHISIYGDISVARIKVSDTVIMTLSILV